MAFAFLLTCSSYHICRHRDLSFGPGEVRYVDASSIPTYKQPESKVYKCLNPPSCTWHYIPSLDFANNNAGEIRAFLQLYIVGLDIMFYIYRWTKSWHSSSNGFILWIPTEALVKKFFTGLAAAIVNLSTGTFSQCYM